MAKTQGSNAEADTELEGIQWWSMRSKRSEAFPKTSLFGTSLENVDKGKLESIKGKYIPVGYIRNQAEHYPLPDHIKERIPGRDHLESSRKEILQQQHQLLEADRQLKLKAQQALAFSETLHQSSDPPQTSLSQSARPAWLTEEDLKHSQDINIVGLNKRGSYNRDKYGTKPRRHNYSLIGDVLATKMDMNMARAAGDIDKYDAYNQGRSVVYGRRRQQLPFDPVKDLHYAKDRPQREKSLIELPANIRHMFGSRICDSLLSDKDKVNTSLERRKAMSGPPRPSKKEDIKSLPVNFNGNYESLGATTRYNVFPGLTSGHTISRTQQEFNDEVHLRRVPNPDEFRYQRDELSIWVEQDVLRARMQKKWQSYFESLPKASVTWDRNASRPVKAPDKTAQPKAKPKSKPKQQQKQQKEKGEDEIVFVTPPLTPPPMEPDIVEAPATFKRDDEFWAFFDQPVPK